MINTGGTIGLTYVNGQPHQLAGSEVLAGSEGYRHVELAQVQSYALEWRDLVMLRSTILKEAAGGEQRFILLSGTDAAEELTGFLELIELPARVAVLVSLAVRPSPGDLPSFDNARAWIDSSVEPATSFWCDDGRVPLPVEKVFSSGRWSFRTRGSRSRSTPALVPTPSALATEMPHIPITPVGIGSAAWICQVLNGSDFDGVVVEAYAAGDVPPSIADAIAQTIERRRPVVLASQSRPGMISSAFPGLKGASAQLLQLGAVGAGSLTAPVARIRLAIALASSPRLEPHIAFADLGDQ